MILLDTPPVQIPKPIEAAETLPVAETWCIFPLRLLTTMLYTEKTKKGRVGLRRRRETKIRLSL